MRAKYFMKIAYLLKSLLLRYRLLASISRSRLSHLIRSFSHLFTPILRETPIDSLSHSSLVLSSAALRSLTFANNKKKIFHMSCAILLDRIQPCVGLFVYLTESAKRPLSFAHHIDNQKTILSLSTSSPSG